MKKNLLVLMALFGLFFLVACGDDNDTSVDTPTEGVADHADDNDDTADEVEVDGDTVTITDRTGLVEISRNPGRVIAMDLGTLDTLTYFGIDVVAVPQETQLPVFLSQFADESYVNLGGLRSIDVEAVYAAQPDVIFVSGRQEEWIEEFLEFTEVVFVHDSENYMDDFSQNMTIIGLIFGIEDEVATVLADIEGEMAEANYAIEDTGLNALVVMANEDNLSAFGPLSRFGIIHNDFGFTPTDADIQMEGRHGMQISVEYVADVNPDIIFTIDRQGSMGNEPTAGTILSNPLVDATNAAQNDRIVFLDSAAWYLVSGGVNATRIMIAEVMNAIQSFE